MLAEMRDIFGPGARAPGMPANKAIEEKVASRFKDSGFVTGEVRFRAPVFLPGKASLQLAGAGNISLQAMHPTLMRPGNFSEPEFSTRLVYLARGEYDDLGRVAGTDLDGAVALMEFDCGERWIGLLRLGIKGFIFIGRDHYDYTDSYTKTYNTETGVPRFFVSAEDGARLRAACERTAAPEAVILSEPSRWKMETLRDLWVLVPGSDAELSKEAVVLTAPMDANSVVPERAFGGQSAGNLYLLLKMLEVFKAEPPRRSVMLAAVNAHTDNFLGERLLAWHLLADQNAVEEVRYTVAVEMRIMRLYTEMYRLLQLEHVDLNDDDLQSWLEVLWQLDAQQHAEREAEQAKAEAVKERLSFWDYMVMVGPVGWSVLVILMAIGASTGRWIDIRMKKGYLWSGALLLLGLVIGSLNAWNVVDREKAIAAREAGGYLVELSEEELDKLSPLDIEPVLDLAPFTEEDYRAAIDAVTKKLRDESKGFVAKLTIDEQAVEMLKEDIKRVETLKILGFDEMKQWAARVKTVFDDEKLLESWRSRLDGSTGKRRPVKEKLQEEAMRTLNRLKMRQMAVSNNKEMDPDEKKKLLEEMQARRKDLTKVLVLFNKLDIGIGRNRVYYRQIATNDVQRKILKGYRDALVSDFSERRRELRDALDLDTANDSVRAALGKTKVSLVINLDVNWNSDRFGFCSFNPYVGGDWQVKFGKAAAAIAEDIHGKGNPEPSPFVNALSREGGRTEQYFFHSTVSPAPYFHGAQQTPAFSLRSVFVNHGAVFSPADTFDRLDAGRMSRLHTWILRYLQAILADRDITASDTLGKPNLWASLWSTMFRTFTFDQFSGKTVPNRAVPGCLISLYTTDGTPPFLVDGDVVNCYRTMSEDSGTTVLYGIRENSQFAPIAYQLDDDFDTVLYDVDKGRVQTSKQLTTNIYRLPSWTLPVFPCTEFPVYDRMDPTLVSDAPIIVQKYWPMSAAMKSQAQKYSTHGLACLSEAKSHVSKGPASVSIWRKEQEYQPERLLLLTNDKRAVLNATAEETEGAGFLLPDELGPDFFAHAARDMDVLNRDRLLKMKGVSNELVTDFLAQGGRALAEMEEKKADNDHNGFLLANYTALGNEVKAYDQIRAMNADMLKAIVLYMALMLPFCFFLQKLLCHFTKLEHDMFAFVLMFTGVYVVFRLIHPAFRIAKNPEAIFIAFVLGAIGCFVIWILHKRFETEMQVLFGNTTGMEGDVAYATVGQTAMIIGVNNMKRRRIRTSLTTATIVLVVFTMLAFSSVSKKMRPTLINKANESPYTGIFYHWPAGRPMDDETVIVIENIFGGRADVLVRRILYPAQPMLVSGPETTIDVQAVIGLPPAEDGFLDRLPLMHGRNFSSPLAREIMLPGRAFEALKIPDDQVGRVKLRVRGEELTLVGVIDDERYRFMRDLNPDMSLLPRSREQAQEQRTKEEEEVFGALTVDMAAVAFMPDGLAAKFDAKPFTVSLRFPENDEGKIKANLWTEVSLFLSIARAKFYVGTKEDVKPDEKAGQVIRPGIYYIGSSYRTSIGGMSRLFIPLLIAGSIILNTMLGTVYERKYEIAVYNAIGLNPTHIFMFFLAEAFVYGVIGSVGGYLIGQLLAMLIKALKVVEGINVNFSSLMVGYAILFTIALVLLSTIYPGIVATKTAVPSGKRKWSMPEHDGRRMQVVFPFIYQPHLAPGVMYYLHEYFSKFTEQTIGDQIASLETIQAGTDSRGRTTYHLKYGIALAPFDLGVTQSVSFTTHFDDIVGSYRVYMTITRVSGQDMNWVTTNKPFMEKLRKLLIRWRNIDPTQHEWYVEQGNKLFVEAETGKKGALEA